MRDFPGNPVVRTLPLQWVQVQSLGREQRSHMPHDVAKKFKKEKKKEWMKLLINTQIRFMFY